MRTLGSILVLVGLVAGLVLAALLFQWDSSERASAMATPTETAGASASPGTASAAAPASGTALTAAPKASGAAPTAQPAGESASGGAIQNGKVVYNKFCNGCHPNGKAGVGPVITSVSEATIKTTVRQGRGGMPAFGEGQISDDQLAELVAYVKSLQ